MAKIHDLKSVILGGYEFQFFYLREKPDINGNSRFRVYIIDPDGAAVHERIFKCYESQIQAQIERYIDSTLGITLPF